MLNATTNPITRTIARLAVERIRILAYSVNPRATAPNNQYFPKNQIPAAKTKHNGRSFIHETSSLNERQPRKASPHINKTPR